MGGWRAGWPSRVMSGLANSDERWGQGLGAVRPSGAAGGAGTVRGGSAPPGICAKGSETKVLFLTFMTPKEKSTVAERTRRRMDWKYPSHVRVLGEYWLANHDPEVVVLTEADDALDIIQSLSEWDDLFDMKVVPAITVEAGLAKAREMYATAVA